MVVKMVVQKVDLRGYLSAVTRVAELAVSMDEYLAVMLVATRVFLSVVAKGQKMAVKMVVQKADSLVLRMVAKSVQ